MHVLIEIQPIAIARVSRAPDGPVWSSEESDLGPRCSCSISQQVHRDGCIRAESCALVVTQAQAGV